MNFSLFFLLFCMLSGLIHLLTIVFIYKLKREPKNTHVQKYPPLTILICARNEAHNLIEQIPIVCDQNYPNVEVLVVNHRSVDESAHLLERFEHQYANLTTIECDEDWAHLPGKRSAIWAGLQHITSAYVLLTDADCIPTSEHWAEKMMQAAMREMLMSSSASASMKKKRVY